MSPIVWILIILACAAAAGFGGYAYRKNMVEAKIQRTEELAKRVYDDAVRKSEELMHKAEDFKKEKVLEARETILRERDENERQKAANDQEIRERRADVQRQENRLAQREDSLDKKTESLENREQQLNERQQEIQRLREEAEELHGRQQGELERIAAMSQDEARQIIVERVTREAYHDAAGEVRRIEQTAKEEAEKRARNVIALAIQRCAADHVAETTVSIVNLPNDDMKGRIIGREGRNIRALEQATGVDLIIDDTPEAIIISAFDPVRREVARQAIERLVMDGRINPGNIESMVEKAKRDVEKTIQEAGDNAVFQAGVQGLHPELVRTLGRLKYRTSYGQNVLLHSLEVCYLAGLMASELGADVQLAKRAGLLHDIGKAINHEAEGTHVTLGAELARKYRESNAVVHAILAHHNDIEPQTIEAVLVQAADAISAARPGARRESLENYIKRLQKLEEIATGFQGVEKCFAIQSGREVRIMVKPEDVTDDGARVLAREIAKRIEAEMEYPGQIRVNVIREVRVVETAK